MEVDPAWWTLPSSVFTVPRLRRKPSTTCRPRGHGRENCDNAAHRAQSGRKAFPQVLRQSATASGRLVCAACCSRARSSFHFELSSGSRQETVPDVSDALQLPACASADSGNRSFQAFYGPGWSSERSRHPQSAVWYQAAPIARSVCTHLAGFARIVEYDIRGIAPVLGVVGLRDRRVHGIPFLVRWLEYSKPGIQTHGRGPDQS